MMIQSIKKRNGEIVKFQPEKISSAIEKAFIAIRGSADSQRVKEITGTVVAELEKLFLDKTPSVENVQDAVERAIALAGYFDVARAYIVYRYEHAKIREKKKEEVLQKIEENALYVTKRNGMKERFSTDKLRKTISTVSRGFESKINVDEIVRQCELGMYDGMKTSELAQTLLFAVRSFIEKDPAYSTVAARLLNIKLSKEAIGAGEVDFDHLETQYRAAFIRNIKTAVELKRLNPEMLNFDLEKMAASLRLERDDLFTYLGLQTLYDRYFLQNTTNKVKLETPQAFWMRVAMGLAIAEKKKEEWALKFYEVMSTLRYVPSTPTLFHAGAMRPQLSSCYLNTVDDSLDHIFKVISDNAQMSKYSGGLGTDWTNLRATGAYIKSIDVESQGVIPFLKVMNDTTAAINRSGRRRGAACAYLELWHADIEDFLELRKNTGEERRRTHDMDTASWIPDLFMKRLQENGVWTLFSPDETPDLHHLYGQEFEQRYGYYEQLAKEGKIKLTRTLQAKDLWKKMLASLYETGHPWITWKDSCNIRSPQDHVGVIHNSNLCTEITLNTSTEETAVCNLGSVNLARHIMDSKFDRVLVQETVEAAMRMLDNVIDINYYPTIEGKTSNLRHRPVGLGIMGFQDALYLLDIDFASDACVDFADESMEVVSYYTIATSSKLAKERGTYESYKGSKWDRGIFPMDTLDLLQQQRGLAVEVPRTGRLDWAPVRALVAQYGMRNSNCMACAPTATISNIAGCLPTIEPIYKNLYVKSNVSGDFVVLNTYLVEDLRKINLWNEDTLTAIKFHDGSIADIPSIPERTRAKYKEVFEIDPKWLIKAAAYRGKWIDQSQSLNLYFRGTSGAQLSELYVYAWKMGIKTTYYLRTLAASQVEKSTVAPTAHGVTHTRKQEEKVSPSSIGSPVESAAATAHTAARTAGITAASDGVQPSAMLSGAYSNSNLTAVKESSKTIFSETLSAAMNKPVAEMPQMPPKVKILKNDLGEDAICEGCQ